MSEESEALIRKIRIQIRSIILQLEKTVKHFPNDQKFTLTANIRNSALQVMRLAIECEKKFYRKTALSDLNAEHEVLREYLMLAASLEYFHCFNGRIDPIKRPRSKATRVYLNLNDMINTLGSQIGTWIKMENKEVKYNNKA